MISRYRDTKNSLSLAMEYRIRDVYERTDEIEKDDTQFAILKEL